MARLYCVEGQPEVIDSVPYEALKEYTAYVVEIEITAVNKRYPFPLIIQKEKDKIWNRDTIEEPVRMVVDDIYLEDLIKFQKIDFTVIRGYGFRGKKDFDIQKLIRFMFNKRAELKKEKNPLQEVYKLIMNSCYGKTIQRPIDRDEKVKYHLTDKQIENRPEDDPATENEAFIQRYYFNVIDDHSVKNSARHLNKVLKPIDQWFNNTLLGFHILSMSKRIMNEVMCLAYDIGCHIYYQDTDSMHIEEADIEKLAVAYKKKYHRELIGSDLGQFHSDFATVKGKPSKSQRLIAVGKKVYLDELVNEDGDIDYHIRCKGVTQQAITHAGAPLDVYQALYEGREFSFDLTQGRPAFKMSKDMTVKTLPEFTRRVKGKYLEGSRERYFEQK
jgi:hypothetical protein